MNTIELQGVCKTYPGCDEPAVKNLDLTVEKGAIITLLGPSGCGKSTTLRMIAGFERPEKGIVSLDGKPVSDGNIWVPPEKRGVGMVFQDYALFPHLNVFDNVGFGYKGKDKKGRVAEVLNLVGLTGFEDRYPNELSGGQQQRVALARALAPRPVVVLLDEPFSNLDADMRASMRTEVKRIIKEAGTTAVLVSHDQKDALAISDRVMVMNTGIVQQEGTPKEVYQYPENNFVANFVGQTNILAGIIGEDERSVITDIGTIPCEHTHGHFPGEQVSVSIRPESIEYDESGPYEGVVQEYTFTGVTVDAVVRVDTGEGDEQKLKMHFHPEQDVTNGDHIRFKVLPDFVAVIREQQNGSLKKQPSS